MESVLGFHMMNVKLRRIFLPVEAENVFLFLFLFSPEFSINTFYKTDQGPFALPRDEFLHNSIRNSIDPRLIEWKDQDI